MNIERYTSKYETLAKDFECGNIVIDNFLKNGGALDENQGITYVLLSDSRDFIIGYYNIEVGRVDQIEILVAMCCINLWVVLSILIIWQYIENIRG